MTIRILDANVLLDRPVEEIIQSFPPCKIIIPFAAIQEIDQYKGLEDLRGANKVKTFMKEGYIELEALTYIRGRSIPGQWVIIDEAQNLSRENIKTIITRVGKGTKIVITGDIQQIDNCRLTATSNGFVTLIEAFKGQNLYAHVTLSKTERSSLAALGVKLL